MDQRGTHQRARGAPRGHRPARAGYDDRLLESSCHLWPASSGPPGDSVYDRGLGNGTPCDASNSLRMRLAPRSRRRRAQSLLHGQSHEHGNGKPRHRPSDSSSRWIGADERVATRMVVPPDSQHAHHRRCQRSAALAVGPEPHTRARLRHSSLGIYEAFSESSSGSSKKQPAEFLAYVADSESNSVRRNPGWKRGIRIGNISDGFVTAFIPDPVENAKGTSAAEGVAADSRGNIYGAEVGPQDAEEIR